MKPLSYNDTKQHGQAIWEIHREAADNNVINIVGEITQEMHYTVTYLLSRAIGRMQGYIANGEQEKVQPIKIYINSEGGCLLSSLGIVGMIDTSPIPIYTYCMGYCASGAAYILTAGHQRYCFHNAQIMLHSLWGGTVGHVYEIEDAIRTHLKPLDKEIIKHLKRNTHLTPEQIKDIMVKDIYFSAYAAKKAGIVDHIIRPTFKDRNEFQAHIKELKAK